MTEPYYADDSVTLWLGDCREVLPALNVEPDCVIADPPYAETSLAWDRWPDGWPDIIAGHADSMWCFGSMRMFLHRRGEFASWRLSQDVVWEKQNGSGFAKDRFRRVHENALHWYRGDWRGIYHEVPRVPAVHKRGGQNFTRQQPAHTGSVRGIGYEDDGLRLMRSVLRVHNANGYAIHPSEKPVDLVMPLIEYACPPGGIVLDPFAGSGSTAAAALLSGRHAVLIERHEPYCERAATRLSQGVLALEAT